MSWCQTVKSEPSMPCQFGVGYHINNPLKERGLEEQHILCTQLNLGISYCLL